MGDSYKAFLSYSHADARFARWLHARLETYQLPGRIDDNQASATRHRKLGPIFLDREELPAAEDLSASVRAALRASDVLVVLCSPDAQRSPWVTREIELFRELWPERPILAAIIRGEPRDAFPEALLVGSEPLAADLRKQGDGRRLGFLKIVAGIAGVPLDALVQRDAQRKLRRVTVITLMTAAAAVVMSVMTYIAIQSRNEAQRQRSEAEGLVEYMLTDLRTELRGVGRLDVMEGVNGRAMAYYEAQSDLSGWPAESLERRSRILHAMGEDETHRTGGDLSAALDMFREAHRTTATLLAQDLANPDRIFGHAQSEYWIGRIAELRKDFPEAYANYEKYRDLARALAEVEPGSQRSLMELGFGELNLGIMSYEQNDFAAAGVEFDRAIGWIQRALEESPKDRSTKAELANAYAWRSSVYFKLAEFAEALSTQKKAAALKKELLEVDPENLEAQFSLLIAERALALNRIELGEVERGRTELRQIGEESIHLLDQDQSNLEWADFVKKIALDLVDIPN